MVVVDVDDDVDVVAESRTSEVPRDSLRLTHAHCSGSALPSAGQYSLPAEKNDICEKCSKIWVQFTMCSYNHRRKEIFLLKLVTWPCTDITDNNSLP